MSETPPLDNPLWAFSLSVYGRPGVADEFLTLQDELGLDVTVALFCLWLGLERGHALTPEQLDAALALVGDWHASVVRPLRGVRRSLKTGMDAFAGAGPLRSEVKRMELLAEQIELASLAQLGAGWPIYVGSPERALGNLDQLLMRLGARVDSAPIAALRAALNARAASAPAP